MPTQDRIETRIQFRAGDPLFAFLARRAMRMNTSSPDIQARAEIETWRAVMAAELRRIRLTLGEASCLADILSGHLPAVGSVSSVGTCYAECHQAFHLARETPGETSYGARWGISEDVLRAKLQRLGPAADLALEDAIARWHQAPSHDATTEGFANAGLRILADPRKDGSGGSPHDESGD